MYVSHREFLFHLVASAQFGDETRLEHHAPVGNAVVEGEGLYGRQLGFVTDAHPRQRRCRPVEPLSATVGLGQADVRLLVERERNLQVGLDARTVQGVDKFFGMVVVATVDEYRCADIRGMFDDIGHGEERRENLVRVGHVGPSEIVVPVAYVNRTVDVQLSVLNGRHEGCRLENGTRTVIRRDGTVFVFVVSYTIGVRHGGNGLDIARLHFHEYADSHLGLELLHTFAERGCDDVLHPHIECGHHITAVDRIAVDKLQIAVLNLLSVCPTVAAFECHIEVLLKALHLVVRVLRIKAADGRCSQIAEGFLAFGLGIHVHTGENLTLAEERKFLQLAVFKIGDEPGRDAEMLFAAVAPGKDFLLEFRHRSFGEKAVQPVAQTVELKVEEPVTPELVFLRKLVGIVHHRKIQEHVVFGQGRGQHLTVGRNDVSALCENGHTFSLEALADLEPVFLLFSMHHHKGFAQNQRTENTEECYHHEITYLYRIVVETEMFLFLCHKRSNKLWPFIRDSSYIQPLPLLSQQ